MVMGQEWHCESRPNKEHSAKAGNDVIGFKFYYIYNKLRRYRVTVSVKGELNVRIMALALALDDGGL